MLSTVITALGTLVGSFIGAAGNVVMFWPVAVMLAFLIIGFAIGWIKKLAGGKGKGKKRP